VVTTIVGITGCDRGLTCSQVLLHAVGRVLFHTSFISNHGWRCSTFTTRDLFVSLMACVGRAPLAVSMVLGLGVPTWGCTLTLPQVQLFQIPSVNDRLVSVLRL
jgi:hypothetical protein